MWARVLYDDFHYGILPVLFLSFPFYSLWRHSFHRSSSKSSSVSIFKCVLLQKRQRREREWKCGENCGNSVIFSIVTYFILYADADAYFDSKFCSKMRWFTIIYDFHFLFFTGSACGYAACVSWSRAFGMNAVPAGGGRNSCWRNFIFMPFPTMPVSSITSNLKFKASTMKV